MRRVGETLPAFFRFWGIVALGSDARILGEAHGCSAVVDEYPIDRLYRIIAEFELHGVVLVLRTTHRPMNKQKSAVNP